mmetsp:Transcript_315/g.1131  ORF Transcript_315/g.1131 Transcript_315/m.1131 type:complete len:214 (-) Transcript_315:29-670(-)
MSISSTRLLLINSSAELSTSFSRRLAKHFVSEWKSRHPDVQVIDRDVGKTPLPHIVQSSLEALRAPTPIDQLTSPEAVASRKLSDELLAEWRAADTLVFAVPMYNFNIPSTLKSYLDHCIRMGETFSYGEKGVEGLIKGKKVFVISTAGGASHNTEMDFQQTYLKKLFSYTGLDEDLTIFNVGKLLFPDAEASAEAGKQEITAHIEKIHGERI